MIKIIVFIVFISLNVFSKDYIDTNASEITKEDIQLMKEFDDIAYAISDETLKSLDIKSIYNYIRTHKSYITDYSLAKVDFRASAGIDDYDYVNDNERDKNYKKTSIQLVYPLFDQKSRKDIKNKKLEYNFKILEEIKKFANLRDKYLALKRELRLNRLIQIKEKLQVKKGVKYLDDRLKTLEKILKLQNDILGIKTELAIGEKILLNYVKSNARTKLKELLNEI